MKWLWGCLSILPMCQAIIKGISLGSGLETNNRALDCFWRHPPEYYIPKLADIGFNSLRIPFSAQYVREGEFYVLDNIMNLAEGRNMSILLDLHRWNNDRQGDVVEFEREELKNVWSTILERYKDRPILTSVGCWNEFQQEDVMFWNNYLKDVILTLEEKFPERFIYYASGVRWAGSLHGMNLEDLPFKERIRYEWHKYQWSSSYDYIHDWNWSIEHSGLPKERIIVGEFGWFSDNQLQSDWATQFVEYLVNKNVRDSYFWMFAQSSGDTGGILTGDCETVDWRKVEILRRLWNE